MNIALFTPGAPRIYTIPPGASFLTCLAEALVERMGAKEDPAALADALIYVPNRRSAKELAAALHRTIDKPAFLPPEIRALGDLESDEPPVGTEEAIAGLGPPLSAAKRLGQLARLVMAKSDQEELLLPPRAALSAARELAALLDQASLSGSVDWSLLPTLVENSDLAHHWERSVKFLQIVAEAWPGYLAEIGAMDPFARRLAIAEALAEHWVSNPPQAPVIIAGSTGATPASRTLMNAVITVPQGAVVLPGVDRDVSASAERDIRSDPSHPQHALMLTLSELNCPPSDVHIWPGAEPTDTAHARAELIHEALAPAKQTSDWLKRLEEIAGDDTPEIFAHRALTGLDLIEADDEAEEAMCAALLLRETLETPGQTAALISPDAGLTRRVSSLLKRWNVTAPPSAGVPLLRTRAGSFLSLILDWAIDPGDPVKLCAVIKHKLARQLGQNIAILERGFLRGPRRWRSLEDLAAFIEKEVAKPKGKYRGFTDAEARIAARYVRELAASITTHAPDLSGDGSIHGQQAAEQIAALAEQLASTNILWSGADGAAAMRLLENMAEASRPLGALPTHAMPGLLETLASGTSVASTEPSHPRLSLLGPLEARLQTADRIILAGLSEGVWPALPGADSFLPRHFRDRLGLQDTEARLGLSAHDFAQLACAPNVTLLTSKRRDDAPAVNSRWVWRLKTLAEGALGDASEALAPAHDPRQWAAALQKPTGELPANFARPQPTPPVEHRPRRLSVTRINTLQRDPYAIYAERVLKLSKLDALDAPIDARLRGTAIHAALEDFEADGSKKSPENLLTLLEHHLRDAGQGEDEILSSRAVNARTIDWYLSEWRNPRLSDVQTHWLEVDGKLTFPFAGENFTLSAQADRIELRKDGALAVVDFKTGNPPSNKSINAGLEQQMPLQAVIAEAGGFESVPAKTVEALEYVAFKATPNAVHIESKERMLSELITDAKAGLQTLLDGYANRDQPYLSVPRIQFISQYAGDFDHLARRAEWAGEIGDE